MGRDPSAPSAEDRNRNAGIRNELRTIAFRLREMQRLQSIRLEQENVRLAAEGLEPVTDADFFKRTARPREIEPEAITRAVESLGEASVDEYLRVTLLDGSRIEGHAGPIDYEPDERLHVELTPTHETRIRYELRSSRDEDRWRPILVRKFERGAEEWTELAQVAEVRLDDES
jgi:hypothetical protein